ncbi:hypothetical protein [Caballeronia sp. LZ034LL]|uniref:hypothetical protein n=1 Tax=Caballeronia sp. LZ034LL TaxID=3038567 RepID=UPI0028598C5E|nr:hypothetical protein [Caballeronia sp. LZ034LL]MDR5836710.1 hypothetical protein [Caballeronia sp. LZ034LL]
MFVAVFAGGVCVEDALPVPLPDDGADDCGDWFEVAVFGLVSVVAVLADCVCADPDCPPDVSVGVEVALPVSLPDAEDDADSGFAFVPAVSAGGICDNVDCPWGGSFCAEDELSALSLSVCVEELLSASLPVEEAGGSFAGLLLVEDVSSSLPPVCWVEPDDDELTLDTAISVLLTRT